MFDVIGDIHGYADELRQLLERMGYAARQGVYAHPDRRAVFVGDFIDRGPQIAEVLRMVRAMVAEGSATAVMGNHEFNALAYHMPDPDDPSRHLREHNRRNTGQHRQTQEQLSPDELVDALAWFRTLPLWLEQEGFRVVHACWDDAALATIAAAFARHGGVTDAFLVEACRRGTPLYIAVDDVLKGKELLLPEGMQIADKEGNLRHKFRTRWFEPPAGLSYRQYALPGAGSIPDLPIPEDAPERVAPYGADEPPVFIGHYWLRPEPPMPLAANVACVDYSVAIKGRLCAYRWDGERRLTADKFVWVDARPAPRERGSPAAIT